MANWVAVMDKKGRVGITDSESRFIVKLDGLFDGNYFLVTDKGLDYPMVMSDLCDASGSTFRKCVGEAEDGKGYQYVDCLTRLAKSRTDKPYVVFHKPYIVSTYRFREENDAVIRYLTEEGFISEGYC